MSEAPILIMAGGTGGHVFPALAVARALRQQNEAVVWLGTERGLEARVVPAEGIPTRWIRVRGLRRKGLLAWVLAPVSVAVAILEAWRVVAGCRPKVVLGMGGYTAGPGGVAAWLLRRPLVIHEQNAVAGLTNRLLAHLAREVLEAFPRSFPGGRSTRVTGNPVRADIAALPGPDARFAGRTGPLRLLVLGGSQGARALNETVPAALALLNAELPASLHPQVRHQAGESTLAVAEGAYRAAGVEAQVHSFISDMAGAYGWADLVIARSGALTVAELAAAGVGSFLIPYPAAVDDHQTRNAAYLAEAGAATVIPQAELSPGGLARALVPFARDRGLALDRARRARSRARPTATADIVAACLGAARSPHGRGGR